MSTSFDITAQDLCRFLRLGEARGLHFIECRAGLAPHLCAFAALAEGQAHDLHVPAALCVERDRAASPPDEIAGVRDHHEAALAGFRLAH
jgi:hypothetical protein